MNIACLCWSTRVKRMADWPSAIPSQYQYHSFHPILRLYLQGRSRCLFDLRTLPSVNMCVLMGRVLGVCRHGYLWHVFRVVFRDYWHVNGSSNCDNRTRVKDSKKYITTTRNMRETIIINSIPRKSFMVILFNVWDLLPAQMAIDTQATYHVTPWAFVLADGAVMVQNFGGHDLTSRQWQARLFQGSSLHANLDEGEGLGPFCSVLGSRELYILATVLTGGWLLESENFAFGRNSRPKILMLQFFSCCDVVYYLPQPQFIHFYSLSTTLDYSECYAGLVIEKMHFCFSSFIPTDRTYSK